MAAMDYMYGAELEAERAGWYEFAELVRSLTPGECLIPGYYHDPDWAVRDLAGMAPLSEAASQLERIAVGTYEGHDIDVDALNAQFLAAMEGMAWDVAWLKANAGRTRLMSAWSKLQSPDDEAAWWIRKSGDDAYPLPLLRDWVGELVARRAA